MKKFKFNYSISNFSLFIKTKIFPILQYLNTNTIRVQFRRINKLNFRYKLKKVLVHKGEPNHRHEDFYSSTLES